MKQTISLSRQSATADRAQSEPDEDRLLGEVMVFARIPLLVSLLCVVCSVCVSIRGQNWTAPHPGVEYAQVDHKLGNDPAKINLLRLDLTKVRLDVHHALDSAIGTEKTSSIATRYAAIAAINAGFFRFDNSIFAGDATGALRIDGADYSEAFANRVALLLINDSQQWGPGESGVYIGHFGERFKLHIAKKQIEISGINRERKSDELVVYTPEFHRTTLTNSDGVELIIQNGKVREIVDGRGSQHIPASGYVVSASGKVRQEILRISRVGSKVSRLASTSLPMSTESRSNQLSLTVKLLAEDIVAGVPQLIKGGKIDITWEQEKASRSFVDTRHPRTAVAKLKDGKFLMITVDGRQPGVSVGMNLKELADYLLSLGAVEAMNLDGGGSTTMFLEGKVVNTPSDKEGERKVSDAILVTLRRKSRR